MIYWFTAVLTMPRAQLLMERLSVKAISSPGVSLIIMLRPRIQTACSRVRWSLGEAVVLEVPFM